MGHFLIMVQWFGNQLMNKSMCLTHSGIQTLNTLKHILTETKHNNLTYQRNELVISKLKLNTLTLEEQTLHPRIKTQSNTFKNKIIKHN